MAEYIEREALLSELQEEIDFETSMYTYEQNKYFNMGLKCAVRDVKSQPTSDVVPKSEVRDIFEEIEASLYYKMVNGEVTLMIRESDYHELKKKYTGD